MLLVLEVNKKKPGPLQVSVGVSCDEVAGCRPVALLKRDSGTDLGSFLFFYC